MPCTKLNALVPSMIAPVPDISFLVVSIIAFLVLATSILLACCTCGRTIRAIQGARGISTSSAPVVPPSPDVEHAFAMFAREDQHMEREDMDVVEGFWENAGDETPSQSAHASSRLTSRLYLLAATKFVSHLDAAAFAELYAKLEWLHLQPGEHLFAHDDAGDDGMFVVIRGSLGVYRDGTLISQYVRGESCGEFSMLTGARRIHTVKALSEVQLIKLPAALFSQFVAQRPGAFVSFMLTNVIRQWRLAHFVLHDFFRLSPPNQPPEVIVRTTSSDPSTVFAAAAACPQSSNHISIGSNSLGIVRFDCDSELFTELKSQTDRLKFAPGEIIFKSGTRAPDKIYVLLSGKVVATETTETHSTDVVQPVPSRTLQIGELLGGHASLTSAMHSETLRSLSMVEVAVISPQQVHGIAPPAFVVELFKGITHQLQSTMQQFTEYGMQRVVLRGAQCAFRSGQTAAEMFIISSGRLRMLETSQRDGRVIEAGRGECIGETSLCAGLTVHSSTFVCVRDTEMIKLSTAAFRFLVNAQPQALIKLSGVMAKRLALLSRTNAGPSRAPSFTSPAELDSFVNASKSTAGSGRFANVSTITIVPTSALVDSAAFTATLSTALSAHGRVKIIDFDAVLKNLAISDNAEGAQLLDQFYYRSRCAAWLTELEQEYRYLLLIANHDEHSGWSRCALRQADVVLLVAEDSQDPVPSVCENTLVWHKSGTAASFPAPQQAAPISAPSSSTPLSRTSLQLIELVIVHDDDLPLPSGTRRFLDSRPSHLHQHHHLRRGTPTDFARLARYLCGRSVGLVLSGGGARGLAHLGVIKAMNEQGIPIDFIGGTSQGSFMAALFGCHPSAAEMELPCRTLSARMGDLCRMLRDFTLPLVSWFKGEQLSDTLQALLGADTCYEDLWVHCFAVTTNVTKSQPQVHRRGVVWRAVRASMSLLQLLPPMRTEDGELLIDGGYVSNLPVDAMRELYAPAVLIASDIENKEGSKFQRVVDFGDNLSGWWLMWRKIGQKFGVPLHFPPFSDIIGTLQYANHYRDCERVLEGGCLDVYIRPSLGNAALLDYHRMTEIVSMGFREATAQLMSWRSAVNLNTTRSTATAMSPGLIRKHNDDATSVGLQRRSNSQTNLLAAQTEPAATPEKSKIHKANSAKAQ